MEDQVLDDAISAIENWESSEDSLPNVKSVLRKWLGQGLPLKRLDELSLATTGFSLLGNACCNHDTPLAEYMLGLGLCFNKNDKINQYALHWACLMGLAGLVEKLLCEVDDIDLLDEHGNTPLCLASREGDAEIVTLLCANGAEINMHGRPVDDTKPTDPQYTPLELAARNQQHGSVEVLLHAGANPNLRGEDLPLEEAILHGDSKCVELLLYAGAEVDFIEVRYLELLDQAVAQTIIPGTEVLQAKKKRQLIREFARKRPPKEGDSSTYIDTDGKIRLRRNGFLSAIDVNDSVAFKYLFDGPVRVGELRVFCNEQRGAEGVTAVMRAARAGAARCLRYMLHTNPDLSLMDILGQTALHHACISGQDECVRALIGKGAPVDICSRAATTPLCVAAIHGQTAITKLLIDAGANVDGKVSLLEHSPLYCACSRNYRDVALALLESGADANYGGFSIVPLEQALMYGSAALVADLLSAGASTDYVRERCWIDLRIAAFKADRDHCPEAGEKIRMLESAFETLDIRIPAKAVLAYSVA
jgi:ankyrin repeat protein